MVVSKSFAIALCRHVEALLNNANEPPTKTKRKEAIRLTKLDVVKLKRLIDNERTK